MDNTGYTDGGNSHIFDYVLMRVLENMRRTYQGKTELTAIMDDGSSHKVRIVVDNTSGKRGLVTVYDSTERKSPSPSRHAITSSTTRTCTFRKENSFTRTDTMRW